MVLCKFFLQGNCRYGDYCKFEHQLNDNFNSIQNKTSASILRQSHFGAVPQTASQAAPQTAPASVDPSSLIKSVVNDMTVAEKGGQWLLSCYAPYKEKPAFPGFEDQSFEEIRLGYYEAVKNGTLEQYKQQVQLLLQQAVQKLKLLQSPSPDIVNMLKAIYNTPPSSHAGVFGSHNTTTNIFANNTNISNSFNQQQQTVVQQPSSSIFAQANQGLNVQPPAVRAPSIFGGMSQNVPNIGAPANKPLFGNNQMLAQSTDKSIFGQGNTNLTTGGSIFGGAISSQPANLPFGSAQGHSSSIFGGQTNSSVQQNISSPFGMQPQAQTNNMFATPSTNTPNFGNQNVASSFGQTAPQTSIFGPSPMQSMQQTSPNTYGTVLNQPQNQAFGNTSTPSFITQQEVDLIFFPSTKY
ncbi:hypothetical protein NQ318_016420 [Aromia moschata]|uniref:Nucleoporin NUP42 n=1 Tax=Aromia moschata TaxID=1265417 RepID=A0AAV8Z697_9CUCU|nr:hypothetical protein NQ318_016420 [Aromia moschata]